MKNWLRNINKRTIIKNSFLLPILLVVIMSISHVVSWYDLGNPMSWAIYLSAAIEVFALASVAAASIKFSRFSVWMLFGIVTSIQIIGNIFFTFQDISITSGSFLAWVEMVSPLFEEWDVINHRRLLAVIQGGTLPLMSLIALHYYIIFNDKEKELLANNDNNENTNQPNVVEIKADSFPKDILEKIHNDKSHLDNDKVKEVKEEEIDIKENGTIENTEEDKTEIVEESPKSPIKENQEFDDYTTETEDEITTEEVKEETIPNTEVIEEVNEVEPEKIVEEPIAEETQPINPTPITTNKEVIPTEQWAGGRNKTWQNPQIMPGVNN